MKKFILPILLFMMFIPVVTNAKEYCTIVSGNGKDIGSELECGGEHFYLIDSDENNIKMLAKYNLYTGYIVDKKEELFTSSVSSNLNTYCVTKYGNGYYAQRTIANGTGERQYFCVKKELIEVEETKQNETALGAHGGYEGNPEYPEIGIVQLMLVANYYDSDDPIPYFNYNFMEYNYDESNYKEYTPEYFVDYKKYLNNQNIDIIDMKLITIDEINHIVKTATNHYLPLDEWGIESWEAILYHYGNQDDGGMYYYKVGSLKDNIDNKYNWLWSTTYWTQTMYYHKARGTGYIYFVDTLGNICADYDCPTNFGAGIRPVVTISKSNIKYNIYTKTNGNGTVEVVDSAPGGDSIQFKVSAKKGLKLSGLTITTDSGEKVEFSEEDITTDSSGVLSVSTNKFTMPYENVTIEARWTSNIINPNTGTGISVIIITTILVISSITYMVFKRKHNYIIK